MNKPLALNDARSLVPGLDPIWLALLLSCLLHVLVIGGVRFTLKPHPPAPNTPPLQVVLVNSKSLTRPLNATALAQANLDGGGNTEADRHAQSPLPSQSLAAEESLQAKTEEVKALEARARQLMSQIRHNQVQAPKTPPGSQAPDAQGEAARPQSAAHQLDTARLQARVARDWDQYEKRPKRRFIGARTQEYRFARYVEQWRTRVERIGNQHYPAEARARSLHGQLQLTVSIRANGAIESVALDRSSGNRILDQAALRIVRMAAPFAPLPPEIRKDTDILSITRTWSFTRDDRLSSK